MTLLWIAGGFVLFVGILLLYEYLSEPSNIDREAVEEAEAESANAHEHVLFEHEREVAEAARTEIKEGYSEQ